MVPRKVFTPGSKPPDKHGKAKAKVASGCLLDVVGPPRRKGAPRDSAGRGTTATNTLLR
jgi:hypothetical protein